ncbi:MAG: T9SS type A sorting domain-containing protein [Candidatus Cloacimonetes bacterium]|nr:T9SS type A sorting domain-containing protein [Candidatus Cloacimonadota bacterium]
MSTYNNYPVSGSANVNGWAADYYKFLTGDTNLDISFSATAGEFIVNLLLINTSGDYEIVNLVASGNEGSITLPAFEPEYDYMVMNISNVTASNRTYSFSLEESTLEERNFWAYHFNGNSYSEITATLQAAGEFCNVYVDNELWETEIDLNDVELVARVFDDSTAADPENGIYLLDTQMFGLPSDIDANGKVNILIYDIDDPDINGFFAPNDISGGTHSNNMEVLYIDKNPHGSGINSSYCFSTIAHEFQHLIHYTLDSNEQTWVNEGLSCFAQTVTGWVSPFWMVMYTMNPDNNLLQWTAGPDYPQTWLFMIYLWEHYCLDDQNIISNLVAEPQNGIDGIDAALITTGWDDVSAEDVFHNWVTANYINDVSFMDGRFGYNDNPVGTGDYAMGTTGNITIYPSSVTNTMQHWSVNYITFANLENSLKVTFMGDADYTQYSVRFVSLNDDIPYALYEMELDDYSNGEITLPNNDENYDNVVMIVTDTFGSTGTIEYSFIAEDIVSPVSAPEDQLAPVTELSCYPNPFNPLTTIHYTISEDSFVSLDIYNIKGQRIRKLKIENVKCKVNSVVWDGTDDQHNPVSSGIYYYNLTTSGGSFTKKLLLLK